MNIYAESSAVLAWLLGEEVGRSVRQVLRRAELVMASDLTLVECDRVLIRAVTLEEIDEATAARLRGESPPPGVDAQGQRVDEAGVAHRSSLNQVATSAAK